MVDRPQEEKTAAAALQARVRTRARVLRGGTAVDVPIEDIMQKFVGRFREKKPDWAAFEDAKIEGYKRAQHRFIGAGGSGKHGDSAAIPPGNFTLSIMFVPPGQGNAAHTGYVPVTLGAPEVPSALDRGVVDVPDAHPVRRHPQRIVVGHGGDAADDTSLLHLLNAGEHIFLTQARLLRNFCIGPGDERQAFLGCRDDSPVPLIQYVQPIIFSDKVKVVPCVSGAVLPALMTPA